VFAAALGFTAALVDGAVAPPMLDETVTAASSLQEAKRIDAAPTAPRANHRRII
jgi:hypothetical protein